MRTFELHYMNNLHRVLIVAAGLFGTQMLAPAEGIDKELENLTEKLAVPIKENATKKITVVDFTELNGGPNVLGKYIAEQLTVNLVMSKRDFSVLDRAHLRTILAELKLTSTGLVDPENAKKLGKFAGVDAIIFGTIIPKAQKISLTAKIVTTETSEIVGAARAEFDDDEYVRNLIARLKTEAKVEDTEAGQTSKPPSEDGQTKITSGTTDDGSQIPASTQVPGGDSPRPPVKARKPKPPVAKSFGDLRVELQPLRIVNGNQYVLTTLLTNQSPSKSIWVAVSTDLMSVIKGRLTDPNGSEFPADRTSVSGIQLAAYTQYGYVPNSFSPATELKPNESLTAALKFRSPEGKRASPGSCQVQLEFLVGREYSSVATDVTVNNFVQDIETN
jgi:curli biogenesis system outer membrane secretion channel CsgG